MMRLFVCVSLSLGLAACDGGGVYSSGSTTSATSYEGRDY